MPDKPLFHPNERVDLPDMAHASAGYTDARSRFDTVKQLLGKRARLLEGFRVEIIDQAVAPGQIAVHNGTALDATGRPLNNEAQVNDSRDITLLGASQTFFLEVEYREAESASDGRGFWDPSFDNVAPDLDGKEFNLNATTRTTPNWQIVTPVSTTGFDIETNPDSTRIPVAVLSTTGAGLIDEAGVTLPGSSFSKVVVSNVLEEDFASGVTDIRLLDSRLFADTGTVDIDFGGTAAETLAFISNDRDTGVLGLGAPTANIHEAGEIVRVNGSAATFVPQRTGALPTLTGASEPDVARRMFQGDETRGSALVSSKEIFGGRDDLNVENLKDLADAVASILREMKFGALRPDQTDAQLPTTFTSTRYYDSVGGLAGARSATITIGDGINTLGDFNGTDETPFQAALAFMDAHPGGIHATIVVKSGTYTFTSEVTSVALTKINWVAEGEVSLVMDHATDAMFNLTNATESRFTNFTFTKTGAAPQILILQNLEHLLLDRCTVVSGSMELESGITDSTFQILDSTFDSTAVTSGANIVEVTNFDFIEIARTSFEIQLGTDGLLITGGVISLGLSQLRIGMNGGASSAIACSGGVNQASFNECTIAAIGGANCVFTPDAQSFVSLTMDNCLFTIGELNAAFRSAVQLGGFLNANFRNTNFSGNVDATATQGLFSWGFADTGTQIIDPTLTFQNCAFAHNSVTPEDAGLGIFTENDATFVDRYNVAVRDCVFTGGYTNVVIHKNGSLLVDNCDFNGGGATGNTLIAVQAGCVGDSVGSVQDIVIRSSRFRDITSALVASTGHSAVTIAGPVVPSVNNITNITISDNVIEDVGNITTSLACFGIAILDTTPVGRCMINNNRVRNVLVSPAGILGGIANSGFDPAITLGVDSDTQIVHNDVSYIGAAATSYAVQAGISVNPGGAGTGKLFNATIAHNQVRFMNNTSVTLGGIAVLCGDGSFNINIVHNRLLFPGTVTATFFGGGGISVTIAGRTVGVTISNNFVDCTAFTSVVPIVVVYTTFTSNNQGLYIDNNHIPSHGGAFSILVAGTNSSPGNNTGIIGMSVSNNMMDGMSMNFDVATPSGFIGISNIQANQLRVDGNSMIEGVVNAARYGIFLNFNSTAVGTQAQNCSAVSVSNNHVAFAVGGTNKLFATITVVSCKGIKLVGNYMGSVEDQDNSNMQMGGILVADCYIGFITSNITVGGNGGPFAISIDANSDNIVAAYNMLGADQSFAGVINNSGTNTFGSSNDATTEAAHNINILT